MSKSFKNDLTGRRFGRLTVLEFVSTEGTRRSYWKCRCDCGNIIVTYGNHLKTGHTQTCGCQRKISAKNITYKHGQRRTRLYRIWTNMKNRCYNTNTPDYKNYGARGIKICDNWKNDFQAFYNWAMENGYSENLSIDRIDNNGNYEPDNCRWVSIKQQQRNRRNNLSVEYGGKKMCLAEAAEMSEIPVKILEHRYYRGDRGERLFRPVRKKN